MSEVSRFPSARKARHSRIRKRIHGTTDRPRLNVYRSGKHIYAQIVDDDNGRSIAAASTLSKDVKAKVQGLKKVEASRVVGARIAELAKEKGISEVRFDRGGFLYHGRIRAVAEAARESGLKF